mmetsp:Transcript_34/g.73  ORF Transcript_34/g.73 Transcript_34/m.73 type:complete len:85 (+) Transcript_34:1378-1632(+)
MAQINEELQNMYDEDRKVIASEVYERLVIDDAEIGAEKILEGLSVQDATHVNPVRLEINANMVKAVKIFKKEKEKETFEKLEFI